MLKPPVTYQGAKVRLAKQIIDIIQPQGYFYDVCCGSGAISLELINRGYDPKNITMIDSGLWGEFWQKIGNGTFDLITFENWIDRVPKDKSQIKSFLENLANIKPNKNNRVYVYLLLQAGAFGGKAIWLNETWQNTTFRSYWTPTPTSNRRSPVNPMMPMPETLLERVKLIVEKCKGINGHQIKAENFNYKDGTIYIDPPYKNTTSYGIQEIDLSFIKSRTVYISEGYPMNDNAILLSKGRNKGGISGNRKNINEEWLNLINH